MGLLVDRGAAYPCGWRIEAPRMLNVNSQPGANTPLVAIEARNVALITYLEPHGAREKP